MQPYKCTSELGLPISKLAELQNFLVISSASLDQETLKDFFIPIIDDLSVFSTIIFYLTHFLEDFDEIKDNVRWRKEITD